MGIITHPSKHFNARDIEYEVESNGCWIMKSHSRTNRGYYHAFIYGKHQLIHRYSYELHNGSIPKGMKVLHKCDNPSCINPKHLFLGTLADNMHDAMSKGRLKVGSSCSWAKLNECEVKNMRSLYADGIPQSFLAKFFGVTDVTVHNIIRGKTWAWL